MSKKIGKKIYARIAGDHDTVNYRNKVCDQWLNAQKNQRPDIYSPTEILSPRGTVRTNHKYVTDNEKMKPLIETITKRKRSHQSPEKDTNFELDLDFGPTHESFFDSKKRSDAAETFDNKQPSFGFDSTPKKWNANHELRGNAMKEDQVNYKRKRIADESNHGFNDNVYNSVKSKIPSQSQKNHTHAHKHMTLMTPQRPKYSQTGHGAYKSAKKPKSLQSPVWSLDFVPDRNVNDEKLKIKYHDDHNGPIRKQYHSQPKHVSPYECKIKRLSPKYGPNEHNRYEPMHRQTTSHTKLMERSSSPKRSPLGVIYSSKRKSMVMFSPENNQHEYRHRSINETHAYYNKDPNIFPDEEEILEYDFDDDQEQRSTPPLLPLLPPVHIRQDYYETDTRVTKPKYRSNHRARHDNLDLLPYSDRESIAIPYIPNMSNDITLTTSSTQPAVYNIKCNNFIIRPN